MVDDGAGDRGARQHRRRRAELLGQLDGAQDPLAPLVGQALQRRRLDIDGVPRHRQLLRQQGGAAHHVLAALARADAAQHCALGLPDPADGAVDAIGLDIVLDPIGGAAQGQLAQGHEVAAAKEIRRGAFGLRLAVDLAALQPRDQLLGRHVDQHDLVGAVEEGVGQGLVDANAGDAADHVVEALEVLDVERGPDVDAGGEQLFGVLPALGVARPRRVRMGQLVDEQERRVPGQCRIEIELGKDGTAGNGQRLARQDFKPLQLRRRVGAAMGLDDAGDDVDAGRPGGARRAEHGVGLADTRRRAEVDAQAPAPGLRFVFADPLDQRVGVGAAIVSHGSDRSERGGAVKATWPCPSATP